MIVRTKLIVPEQRSEMVLRQHLTDRLAAGEKRPLILITGCAGAGKTALAVKWLSQKDRHPAWYTLDPRDNDPGLFLRHLLISLLSISDPIDKAVGPLLQGHRSVADPDVAAAVLDAFSAEAGPVYLVFDNFHVLTCRPILDFVAHLIQYAPKALHLVIISRSQPPFPLSRLRAGNRITELHPEALKFSRDETRFYLTRVAGLDLRPDQADTIFEATEGWISGLVLTRAALHRKDPVSAISNITPFVENAVVNEYFNEEVIDTLPPDLQDFLLTICILNRFNAALCREVTGRTGCRDVLTTLYRNHSFIISLDAGGEWFRFHRLFARALRNHPHAISTQKAVLLHKKAALWNARHYLLDQAFDHALKAYDTEFLADLMEDHLMFYFLECDFEPVCRLLDALPAQRIDTSLILSVYRLMVLISTWDLIPAPGLFKALERRKTELLDQCPDRKKEFALALWALAGHAMAAAHDPTLCRLDQLTRDIDHMPETYPLLTLFLSELRLLIQLDRGDLSLSHAFIEDQKELYQTLEIGFGYFTLLRAYAQIEIAMGNMTRATQRLGQWFDQAAGTGISAAPYQADYFYMMSRIRYLENRLDKALSNINKAHDFLRTSRINIFLCEIYIQTAFILQAMGRSSTAFFNMEKALHRADGSGSRYLIRTARAAMAKLGLLQGKRQAAQAWSTKNPLSLDEPFCEAFESDCLVQAFLLLDQARFQEACRLMETLRPRALKRHRRTAVLEADIIRAAALNGLGEKENAVRILELGLCFAVPEQYIQPFVIYSPYIADLLITLSSATDPVVKAHAAVICGHCRLEKPLERPQKTIPVTAFDSLNQKEFDILKLIDLGCSNREIAQKMHISINTVKFYNKSLFTKLSVKNRVQAVTRARQLNIF